MARRRLARWLAAWRDRHRRGDRTGAGRVCARQRAWCVSVLRLLISVLHLRLSLLWVLVPVLRRRLLLPVLRLRLRILEPTAKTALRPHSLKRGPAGAMRGPRLRA